MRAAFGGRKSAYDPEPQPGGGGNPQPQPGGGGDPQPSGGDPQPSGGGDPQPSGGGVVLPLPTEKPEGVSVDFLVNQFEKQVKATFPQYTDTTTFEELSGWIWGTYSDREVAGGPVNVVDLFGHMTMRDGGASLCDAIAEQFPGAVGHATIFISWAWKYRVRDFVEALRSYCANSKLDPLRTFCWICYFCNNQHVWFQPGGVANAVEIFERNVRMVGRVVIVLDSIDFRLSIYFSRLWTIFEVYICIREQLGFELALMPAGQELLMHTPLSRMPEAAQLNIMEASSSNPADADSIRRQVANIGGEKAINTEVLRAIFSLLSRV